MYYSHFIALVRRLDGRAQTILVKRRKWKLSVECRAVFDHQLDEIRSFTDSCVNEGCGIGAGSAGWRLGGRRDKWVFADTTGHAPDGLVSAIVRDLAHVEPGRVRFRVIARGGDYPVTRGGEPLKVLLVVGNSSIGGLRTSGPGWAASKRKPQ